MKFIVIRRAKWRCKSIDEYLEDLPPFLTLEQVKKLLNVSERTIYRVLSNPIAREDLGAFKCGKGWIIPTVGLVEFLQWRNVFNWEETKRRIKRASNEKEES